MGAKLLAIIQPNVKARDINIAVLNSKDKRKVIIEVEDPKTFFTATWHGLKMFESQPLDKISVLKKVREYPIITTCGSVEASTIVERLELCKPKLKIALIAPSGSGKSTAAKFIKEAFEAKELKVDIEKLARPLYQMQHEYFSLLGITTRDAQQHQTLLEHIASDLRMLNPKALVDDLMKRLRGSDADIILTDDLRDPDVDARVLISIGYIIVKIESSDKIRSERLQTRNDLESHTHSELDEGILRIPCDYTIMNDGTLDEFKRKNFELIDNLWRNLSA